MPTYLNSLDHDVAIESTSLPPNHTYRSFSDIPTDRLPVGITKTSTLPIWNPIIYSGIVAGTLNADAIVTIPETYQSVPTALTDLTEYKVNLFCISGNAMVYFNDKNNFGNPLLLITGNGIEYTVKGRRISSIIFSGTAAFSIKVDVSVP